MEELQQHSIEKRSWVVIPVVLLVVAFGILLLLRDPETPSLEAPILAVEQQSQPVALPDAMSQKESTLSFLPNTISTRLGERFTIIATIDPSSDRVNGVETEVRFDPTQLELETIEPSSVFALELGSKNIDNKKGTAMLSLGIPLGNSPIATTSPIATLSFFVVGSSGTTQVVWGEQSIVAAVGASGNVLKASTSATITILSNVN